MKVWTNLKIRNYDTYVFNEETLVRQAGDILSLQQLKTIQGPSECRTSFAKMKKATWKVDTKKSQSPPGET